GYRFEQSVVVEGDAFFAFLARGAIPPWLPESHAQNEIVTEAAAGAAGRYAIGGFTTTYDGVVGPWFLPTFARATGLSTLEYAVLADVIGDDPTGAAAFAARLVEDPHSVVGVGAGLWIRPGHETPRIKQWLTELPSAVDTGDIPAQNDLDRWAADRTLGLIERFPIVLTPEDWCVLATALA